ncbi:MAG: hypothetical protein GY765_11890 [bacterium]|nr:hypothetical protein [bacterium]
MNTPGTYYTPNYKLSYPGLVIMLLFGLFTTLLISSVFGYMPVFASGAYSKVLLPVLFGTLIGLFTAVGAKIGRIPSKKIVIALSVLLSAIAIYSSWIMWFFSFSKHQYLLTTPNELLTYMQKIAHQLVYSTGNPTPHPLWQYTIWLIEAAVIIGTSIISALIFRKKNPFCRLCNRWTYDKYSLYPLKKVEDIPAFKKNMENSDVAILKKMWVDTAIKEKYMAENSYTQIDITYCSKCREFYLLTVTLKEPTKNENGKKENRKTNLLVIQNLLISYKAYRTIKKYQFTTHDVSEMLKEDSWSYKISKLFTS